ncbi:amino acid ABC transporter substrate-binding protein [Pseudomonas sp. v388]|uniref:ABC transporter substrate-binding protein n=1 Tax=Pseudomonas sp. v388 TaxID=2479849 RepID=UPI000F76ECA5|nr:ABC transporter substrate-binding protein [Pseudomonas sp. v388]RRV10718.1 amino acid ABC transporter substrate-binding protein [Pseudomonas sp. v388]
MSDIRRQPAALRVGVSALFDPADTPHARTFLRALCVARNLLPDLQPVQWLFLDDGANPARGAEVARQMIQWKADVVIGHFSSDAAVSAARLYEPAGIALLTPAATIDCLTLEHRNVFRFCPSDRRLAGDLVSWLQARQWRALHIEADTSAHGQALAQAIAAAAHLAGLQQVFDREQAQVEVFAGRLRASRQHWQARRATGSSRPLVLTDDAASPQLGAGRAGDVNAFVIGFGNPQAPGCHSALLHRTLFEGAPETYFRESLLMLYVLAQLAVGPERGPQLTDVLQRRCFATPLGAVGFENGECRGATTRIWQVGSAGLLPLTG